jgi:hypothetical protein
MKKFTMLTVAAAMALGVGAPATASDPKASGKTPDNWSYEIKNGKRVPKANRVSQSDGSWVEEIKQGNCVVTRTGRNGEVRETRKCD